MTNCQRCALPLVHEQSHYCNWASKEPPPLDVATRGPSPVRPEPKASDPETAPQHYRGKGLEPWAVWEAFDLDPWAANVVKYILRAGKKGPALPDLKKARHYLDYMIEKEEGE